MYLKEVEKLLPKKWNTPLHQLLEASIYVDFTPEEGFQDKVTYGPSCLGRPWSAVGSALRRELYERYSCYGLHLSICLWCLGKWTQVEPAQRLLHNFILQMLAHCCQPGHRPLVDLDAVGIVACPSAREQKATLVCGTVRGERGLRMNRWGGGGHGEPRMVTLSPQGNAAFAQAVCLHGHNAVARTPTGTHPLEEAI